MKTLLFKQIILSFCLVNFTAWAQTPSWSWARSAGSSAWDLAGGSDYHTSTIATDASGNSFVCGMFSGAISFGTVNIANTGQPQIFTAKYDPSGNCLWAKPFGLPIPSMLIYNNCARAIGLDASGNCYVTGTFSGNNTDTIYFGNSKLVANSQNHREIFTVKYDANGNELWARQPQFTSVSHANFSNGLTIDGGGNVYIAAFIGASNTGSFGTFPVNGHGSFIVKYDGQGNVSWVTKMGTSAGMPECAISYGLADDSNNNIYVTGVIAGSVTFATSPSTVLTAIGMNDAYVAKIDPAGTLLWVKQFGGNVGGGQLNPQPICGGKGIDVDAIGDVYFTGDYSMKITLGSNTFTTGMNPNLFISKLNGSGNVIWARELANNGKAAGLKVNSIGSCYVSGYFSSPGLCAGSSALPSNSALVIKTNSVGFCQWQATSSAGDYGLGGIGLDGAENVYIAGSFQNAGTFGTHNISNAGGFDVVVAKLQNPGNSTPIKSMYNESNSLIISPNPFEETTTVNISSLKKLLEIRLFDITGKGVAQATVENSDQLILKRNGLQKGIYILHVYGDKEFIVSGKLVIQ